VIHSKNTKCSFSQFCECPKNGLKIYRTPAKFLVFLQAVYKISPYYLSVRNSCTRGPLADANVLNAFSNTMLKVDHSEFQRCYVFCHLLGHPIFLHNACMIS